MGIKRRHKRATAFILAVILCFSVIFDSGAAAAKESAVPEKYAVTVECDGDGAVLLEGQAESAYLYAEGEPVRIRVEPDPGYALEVLTAADGKENAIDMKMADNTAVFAMPAADVVITAVFSETGKSLSAENKKEDENGSDKSGTLPSGEKVSADQKGSIFDGERAAAEKDGNAPEKEGAVLEKEEEDLKEDGAEPGKEKEALKESGAEPEKEEEALKEDGAESEKNADGDSMEEESVGEGEVSPAEDEVQQIFSSHMDNLEILEAGETALLSRASGDEVTIQVTARELCSYADYGLGTWGTRRWEVAFADPDTGEERTSYAYCIQPKKGRPGDCTATLVQLSDNKLISKVIWAGNSVYSGYNSFWNCARRYGWIKGSHWDCAREYGWAEEGNEEAEWIVTHIAASKVNGDEDWDYGANSSARELALELIAFASDLDSAIDYPEIAFSKTDVTARIAEPGDWKTGDKEPGILKKVDACRKLIRSGVYQKTPVVQVSGSSNNIITFTAPLNVYCFEVAGGCYKDPAGFEVLADGRIRYTVLADSEICFIAPLDQAEEVSAASHFTARGAVKKIFTPYKLIINGEGDYQNLAFILGTVVPGGEREASMTVHWITVGNLHMEKKDSCDGERLAGATFRLLDTEGKVVTPTEQNGIEGDIDGSGLITVRGDGCADVRNIPAGSYSLREIHVPVGYRIPSKDRAVKITPGGGTELTVQNDQVAAGIRVQKYDAETGKPKSQGGAVFEKARFRVVALQDCKVDSVHYKSGDTVYDDLTLDKNGYAETPVNALTEGRYRLEETGAPAGYLIGDSVEFAITKEDHGKRKDLTGGEVADPPIRGGVRIKKVDKDTKKTTPQGNASLMGARFEVLSLNDGAAMVNGAEYAHGQTVCILTIGADGTAQTDSRLLPYGDYAVREAVGGQPKGYQWSGENYREFSVTRDGVVVDLCGSPMEDPVIRGGVKVSKYDGESGESRPLGGASLKNMEIAVYNESREEVCVSGQIYKPGEIVHVMYTDAAGCAETPPDLLPCGSYRLVETEPPEGYLDRGEDNRGVYEQTLDISQNGEVVDRTGWGNGITDFVKRGDFSIRKIDADTQRSMAGVSFRVTSLATGESHVFMTDANGYYSTSSSYSPHTRNTNGGKARDGMWFGLRGDGNRVEADDSLGALPYDTYRIEELPGENNRGMTMFSDILTISENKKTVELGSVENKGIAIGTTAKDSLTGTHYQAACEGACIIDTVFYQNLDKGVSYTLRGTLMDKATGEAVRDAGGKLLSAEKTFTPVTGNGSVDVEFVFDASAFAGMAVVVFEELYEGEKKLAEHKDMGDDAQTIHYPGIATRAADSKTSTNVSHAEKEVTLIDTVSFTGLQPGRAYRLSGTLMVKETGEAYVDADGRTVAASRLFVPEEPSGSVDVIFTFNGGNAAGSTLVIFEELLRGGQTYAVHMDIDDESQSVYFPGIGTKACVETTGDQVAMACSPLAVTDTVSYSNLTAGQEYRLKGLLMVKETGKALEENGIPVAAEKTFVPDASSGTVDMQFVFNAEDLEGYSIVIFEELYAGSSLVASHRDMEDDGQTVYIPKIYTTALDDVTGTHEAKAAGSMSITDTVTYENLVPGKTYTIVGTLMDSGTGEAVRIEGEMATVKEQFEPKETDGTAEVTFNFNGLSLAGKTVVVFESLLYNGVEIASHRDIGDERQSVAVIPVRSVKGASVEKEEEKEEKITEAPPRKGGVSGRSVDMVKTGDAANIFLWGAAGLVSLGILAALLLARKKRRKP